MNMKRIFALAVALALALGMAALAEGLEGSAMPDFTVTDTEGRVLNLAGLLEEKELVVLNIFATWCPPCQHEFPEMEEVYGRLGDRMEIVAVSGEPNDTPQVLADFREKLGLTFPMGPALDTGILDHIPVQGFPTTVFIDREGLIGYAQVGMFTSAEGFERVCAAYLGDGYTGLPAVYNVVVADQNGNPVPGVFVNICTDTTCMPVQSDEFGYITFAGEPQAYHLQTIKVPEGYSIGDGAEATTEAESSDLVLWIEAE